MASRARVQALLAEGFARAQEAVSRDTAGDGATAAVVYRQAAAALAEAAQLAAHDAHSSGQNVLPPPCSVAELQNTAAQYIARATALAPPAQQPHAARAAAADSRCAQLEAAAKAAWTRALQLDEGEHPTLALPHYTAAVEKFLEAGQLCSDTGKRQALERTAVDVSSASVRARQGSTGVPVTRNTNHGWAPRRL